MLTEKEQKLANTLMDEAQKTIDAANTTGDPADKSVTVVSDKLRTIIIAYSDLMHAAKTRQEGESFRRAE